MQKLSGLELYAHGLKVSHGMEAARRKGKKIGENGKKLAVANKEKAMQFAAGMAPLVRQLQSAGYVTVKQLADQLNSLGIPSPGNGKWHASNMFKVLKNMPKIKKRMGRPPKLVRL